jgi:hypothetical protein
MAGKSVVVRLSLMKPKPGEEQKVLDLHNKLLEWLPGQQGFVRGYVIAGGDPQARVGHLDIWRTGDDAKNAAQSQHVLSVRSQLNLLIEPESHAEHAYEAFEPGA